MSKPSSTFVKEKFDILKLGKYKEFIHFGLTSQDINNTAFPPGTERAWLEVYEPLLRRFITNSSKS